MGGRLTIATRFSRFASTPSRVLIPVSVTANTSRQSIRSPWPSKLRSISFPCGKGVLRVAYSGQPSVSLSSFSGELPRGTLHWLTREVTPSRAASRPASRATTSCQHPLHGPSMAPSIPTHQSPHSIGPCGLRMTQCGLGPCFVQKASGSFGAYFARRASGHQESNAGSETH